MEVHLLDTKRAIAVLFNASMRGLDDPRLDVLIDVDLEVDQDAGRLVIRRLAAERRPHGPPVTIEVLKGLPLVAIAVHAAASAVWGDDYLRTPEALVVVNPDGTRHPFDVRSLDDELDAVAIAYRWAYFIGLPPTRTVAEILGLTKAVAAKRVAAARRVGLLEPTTAGRKGV